METKITPSLWFDDNAEEAAAFYCSVFPNSRIVSRAYYTEGSPGEPGTVMVVEWELDGNRFTGINGGKQDWAFSEATSFQVNCDDQAEIDHYWEKLGDGGEHGPCGWLKDRFGLSWQITPKGIDEWLGDPDDPGAARAMKAMLGMSRIDIAALQAARAGEQGG